MTYTGKAWQYSTIGKGKKLEEAIALREDAPLSAASSLAKDQLVVEVISAALNPVDYKLPELGGLVTAAISLPATPGLDLCGRVVATHPSNTEFEKGQLVFGGFRGSSLDRAGALRQYTVISSKCVSKLPDGIDPDQCAAVGTGGTTAYQSLLPDKLKPGAKVFINGGTGGVGTWTVQLAKAMGAEVVATCSTDNVDLCQQLGADEVVDYRKVDVLDFLKKRGPSFDLVVDNVGSNADLWNMSNQIVKPGGSFSQVGVGHDMSYLGMASIMKRQLWPAFLGGPHFHFINMNNDRKYFDKIGAWMAEGKVKAVIDEVYSFEAVPEAYAHLRKGHAKGKVVVRVSKEQGE